MVTTVKNLAKDLKTKDFTTVSEADKKKAVGSIDSMTKSMRFVAADEDTKDLILDSVSNVVNSLSATTGKTSKGTDKDTGGKILDAVSNVFYSVS